MTKVFTTGTFDLLHKGHINLLRRAKALGDYLVVGLNAKPEGKTPINSVEDRVILLEAIKYVDEVIVLTCQQDKLEYLKNNKIDIFACGSEYRGYKDISDIEKYSKVVFLDRTEGICTTDLKHRIIDNYEYKTFIIDIDDTICTTYNRDFDNSIPNVDVIDKINSLYDNGWTIILFTARGAKSCNSLEAREEKYREVTERWLSNHNVKYTKLLFGKENADFYVDDKSMSIKEFLEF